MEPLHKLVRKNIWELTPYSSARAEYSDCEAHVFLDANENPYNSPVNRYPDPLQRKLKAEFSKIKGVSPECMFLGNGSDEAIDLLYRIFCNPGIDNVVAIEPTHGMYKVCADINNVEYRPVSLNSHFQIDALQLLAATDRNTKLIWICSPNNPTGNCIHRETIIQLLENFSGIVVIDEAYSDFSSETPFRRNLSSYPNLIVLNTMSKAWGCAAIRLGMAFASQEIISLFNKVKSPYNINLLTQNEALQMLNDVVQIEKWVNLILAERERMIDAFKLLPICQQIYPTEANFFLAKMTDANTIYRYLIDKGVVVRNRDSVTLCHNCLRITIGTKSENQELLAALRCYK